MTARVCLDCPRTITAASKTGRCQPCAARANHRDPAWAARLHSASVKAKQTPESRAKVSANMRRINTERADDPAWQAYKIAEGLRLRRVYDASPEAQDRNLARRRDVGRQNRERALGWCPMDRRAEYERLRSLLGAPEGRRMIEEQIAKDERSRLAAMTPFERQLERVAAGATLIEKPTFRTADPDVTLGGVASGYL